VAETHYPVLTPVGEEGLLVEYEPEISPEINRKVRQLAFGLEQERLDGVSEVIPAYRSLMVYFDAEQVELPSVSAWVEQHARHLRDIQLPAPRLFVIPTVYGGAYGPDLERVATTTGMTPEEVVRLFSSQRYPVYCLGFLCCLAYMGGVPERLRLPRLTTPRTWLPSGSVGFAGAQAVVLPIDQPSGFHYIGRTFVTMYDPHQSPPTPIRPGDFVECRGVSEQEAKRWEARPLGECLVEGLPRS
jgi:KipI family sensor histidine kinase inhibitor